jgi:2-polyprenyl-3-methyl-5-hydroxy-6-metoxy-1,4-benzoquinol methylase
VLDVGCGAGFGANLLAEVAAQVTGIDYSTEAIDYARSRYSRENVSFMVMGAQHLTFNTHFDLAVCFEVLEHVREPEDILRGIRSVLKPNSKVVISTPNIGWERLDLVGLGFVNEHHVHVMALDELERSFTRHFVLDAIFGMRIKRPAYYNALRYLDQLNLRLLVGRGTRRLLKRLLLPTKQVRAGVQSTNIASGSDDPVEEQYELFPPHWYNKRSATSFVLVGTARD